MTDMERDLRERSIYADLNAVDAGVTRLQVRLAGALERIRELEAEQARWRPVVEGAKSWATFVPLPDISTHYDRERSLLDAVRTMEAP